MLRVPGRLTPFHDPSCGFSFTREVQPVVDKYCAGCHDGTRDFTADGRDHKGH